MHTWGDGVTKADKRVLDGEPAAAARSRPIARGVCDEGIDHVAAAGDDLHVLVRLAGPRLGPAVVEPQPVAYRANARPPRSKVGGIEAHGLVLEGGGDGEQVMINDVELVEQADVRGRHVGDEHQRVVRAERVREGSLVLGRVSFLLRQLSHLAHTELS
jgi:hypothetical protein